MLYHASLKTHSHSEMINITPRVQAFITESGITSGICTVYIPHTTAGITINENADPDVVRDIIYKLDALLPWKDDYHHAEGNSAAHLKTMLTGTSQTIIIEHGTLVLGVWQSLYFCEYDGPRTRNFYVKIIKS